MITSVAGTAPVGGHSRGRCLEGNAPKSQQAEARFSLGRASRYHLSPYFHNIKLEGVKETGWRDFISGRLVKQLRGIGAVWRLDREFWSARGGGSRAERFVIGCLRIRCRALLGYDGPGVAVPTWVVPSDAFHNCYVGFPASARFHQSKSGIGSFPPPFEGVTVVSSRCVDDLVLLITITCKRGSSLRSWFLVSVCEVH